MRAALLILTLTGCGRFGIDPRADDVDAAPLEADAAFCAVDGTACDDENVCTLASQCEGGVCVSGEASACRVANLADDYSQTTQGNVGWYYGYWNAGADADGVYQPSDFTPMVPTENTWHPADFEDTGPNFTWCYLSRWGGHPGKDPTRKQPIWRWVSGVSGRASIDAHVRKGDISGGGDGIRGIISVDGVETFAQDVAWDDLVGFTVSVPVMLHVGSTIEMTLDARDNDAVDTTWVDFSVNSR